MPKRKEGKEKHTYFENIMKDLDINRFLDMRTHGNADLFTKPVEGMKEGRCVRTVQQVRHWWKTLKIFFFAWLHVNGNISRIFTLAM